MTMHTIKRAASNDPVQAILNAAVTKGKAELKGVEVLSRALAGMMQEIHGETWEAHVDHDAGFILIKPEVA